MPRASGILVAVLCAFLALAVLPGCGAAELRFDAVPGPVSTADIAMAAADEPVPLSDDEWSAIDALHDRYLADFDALRTELLAPLVRESRAVAAAQLERDAPAMARLSRRHASVLGRIASLDDRLVSDIADACKAHPALAPRIGDRRAIARSARVVEGLGDGEQRSPTLLDLEPSVRGLGLDDEQRAAAEPALAAYRHELALAARALAEAQVEFPAVWLAARTAAGLGEERMTELNEHANEGDEQRQALQKANADLAALLKRTARPTAHAYTAIDDANRRLVDALRTALPAALAARVAEADERRRCSGDATMDRIRMAIDAFTVHPDVRNGKAPRTAKLLAEGREAFAEIVRAGIEAQRVSLARALTDGPDPAEDGADARMRAATERAGQIGTRLKDAIHEEIPDGTLDLLESSGQYTADEVRERLAGTLGPGAAEHVVRNAGRHVFRSDRTPKEPAWNSQLSIAEQLLMAPGMDHAAFRRAARSIGAADDDPLVEQVWERHQARTEDMLVRQRERMRVLEGKSMQAAQAARSDPAAFERSLGEYLQALLNADGERRALDDETFREITIAIGAKEDDARFVLARAVGAARRASLPLRRFRQPWLLGAVWEADADPVSDVLEMEDGAPRAAALAVLAAHAERLRVTADDARRAGLEALRDLLLFGVRMDREGSGGRSPDSYRERPEVKRIVRSVENAAHARRTAQRTAIEATAGVDPALAAQLLQRWVASTFPEFAADGPRWRQAAEIAAGGGPEARSEAVAARASAALERFRASQQSLLQRLAEWQDTRSAVPACASAADVEVNAAMDPALGNLRTVRDESAWRLLRDLALAQGRSPDALMRDDARMGSLERPVKWSP